MSFLPAELIKKKRAGGHHTPDEISYLIKSYVSGELPDYQMSAWCMAVCFQGMNQQETAELTAQMKNSGHVMDFSHLKQRIDKHSTGGVGDKATMILAPIAAAAGVNVPMIAGRGLGHTGGTLDKLESLPGFSVNLSELQFAELVNDHHIAIMGQTEDICPADRKLYALRDVTGTIDSLPLICGSIMSKKLAEDLTGLVLDIKFGSGAFMKNLEDAEHLAQLLKETGERNGVDVIALLTNMNQPLGKFIGNGLEIKECIEILQGKTFVENDFDYYGPTRDLSLILAGYMIYLAKITSSPEKGLELANEVLTSGKALKVFQELCRRQGCENMQPVTNAKHKLAVISNSSGTIYAMNTEMIGLASIELGAGRKRSSDKIDYASGIEMTCHLGMKVNKGDVLAYLYANDSQTFSDAGSLIEKAVEISQDPQIEVAPTELIAKVLH